MHTRSAILFLLALFVRSVHTTDPNDTSPDVIVKRDPQGPPPPNSLAGLIEIRAPSDFDHIARSPTPVSATTEPDLDSEPELESAPAPETAAEPMPLNLESDSPLLDYEGAEVLDKRANCPASPQPSTLGCACAGQSLCKKRRRDRGSCYFLQNDEESCGVCFNKCGPTQQCKNGDCKCSRKSLTECGRKCVNLLNDSRNCGRCGNWCSYNRTCRKGRCRRLK